MPLLRNRIIRRNTKRFDVYKKKSLAEVQVTHPKLYADFLEHKESLKALLLGAKYWHGTGRYQYVHQGDSKYEGVLHNNTKDVLKELCAQGGLQPHYDPWFEKYVHTPMSISLANQWCYGKMYAHYHLDEKKSLQYEIAPVSFWYHVFIWIQLTEHYCKFMFGFLILYTFSSALQKQGKRWMATYRSDLDKKWPFWKILTAQSDINSNYGLLFAITDDIATIPIMKIGRFFETRTIELIPFSKMQFVGVPYENVIETEAVLAQHKVLLPVVPLEFIELFMADFTLHDLEYQSYKL
jgi:hypothetical protein